MIKKIMNWKWVRNGKEFADGIKQEHVSAYAGASAFFIFLSVFPLLNILLMLTPFLPYSEQELVDFLVQIFPEDFSSFVRGLISDVFSHGSPGITIVSIVAGLWSAAKGIMHIRGGLNEVYHSRENQNALIDRLISVFYTAIFVILLLVLVTVNLFGRQVLETLVDRWEDLKPIADFLLSISWVVTFVLAMGMMLFLYTVLPSRKQIVAYQIPGAIFSAGAWVLIAWGFSYYISYTMKQSYMYGSLTTIIMLLFWVYLMVNIIFIGGQINEFFGMYVWPEKLKMKLKKKKDRAEARKARWKARYQRIMKIKPDDERKTEEEPGSDAENESAVGSDVKTENKTE